MDNKLCNSCNQIKNVNEFNKKPGHKGKIRYNYICKTCQSRKNKEMNLLIKKMIKPNLKNKRCNKCNVEKSTKEFTIDNYQLSGLSKLCKSCQGNYYKNNKDVFALRCKAYQEKYKDKCNERKRKWAKENYQKIIDANKKYYLNNKEKILEYSKLWCKNNIVASRNRTHRYRAKKRMNTIQKFTPKQLEQRISIFGFVCAYCGGKFEHIDHVQPISKGGAHCLANLRPSCKKCNLEKFNKTAKQWFLILKNRK